MCGWLRLGVLITLGVLRCWNVRCESRVFSKLYARRLLNVAVLCEEIDNVLRMPIGQFESLGDPGGPGGLSKRWGAPPPTPWKGPRGPRGRPDPQNEISDPSKI